MNPRSAALPAVIAAVFAATSPAAAAPRSSGSVLAEKTGAITAVEPAAVPPALTLTTAAGERWTVQLAEGRRAGTLCGRPGDRISVIGEVPAGERRIIAVRLALDDSEAGPV